MMKMFFRDIEKPLYGLEIAQSLKASPGTTHRELTAMLKQGVLRKKKEGALVMYFLNSQHPHFFELRKAVFPPKKRGHRVLFLSDLHLSAATPADLLEDLDLFIEYALETASEVVLLGDIIEMLQGDVFRTYLLHKPIFDRFVMLSHELKVTYVVGNHDVFLRLLCGEGDGKRFFDSKIAFAESYYDPILNIHAEHGHRFDDQAEMKGFKPRKTMERPGQALLAQLRKLGLQGGYADRLEEVARSADQAALYVAYGSGKKSDTTEKFQDLAEEMIHHQDYSYVVMGHTHQAHLKSFEHGIYFNTGSWRSEKKRQFVEIDRDGGALVGMGELK